MSRAVSASLDKQFGVARVSRALGVARSSVYASRSGPKAKASPPARRGPKTEWSDEELCAKIEAELNASPFTGEGHRKIWARLRMAGVRTSKARTLRLMRLRGWLAPHRQTRALGPRNHDGKIVTDRPNEMWGTDLSSTQTIEDGQVAVFIAVDHCTAELVGVHAAKRATRHEALEPIRQGVRERFGRYEQGAAVGLKVRHDHGSQYVSDGFQGELAFLGAESSPSFVRAPEGNGCAERMIRTLKEQLLWAKTFRNVEELRLAMAEWAKEYNEKWLVERHGFRSPKFVYDEMLAAKEAA